MKALTIGANSEVLEPGIGRELVCRLNSRTASNSSDGDDGADGSQCSGDGAVQLNQ